MSSNCEEPHEQFQMDQSKPMNTVPEGEKPSTSSEVKTNQRETSEDQRIAENIKPVLLGNKFFIHVTGKTLNSDKEFMDQLKNSTPCLQEVETVDECDFILVFCPVVSRAGTDIEAAEKNLHKISATKPAVLVVLHHTFDPGYVVSESSRAVTRENMITYDCLFHEDQGLLQCKRNADVINDIKTQIKTQTKRNKMSSNCEEPQEQFQKDQSKPMNTVPEAEKPSTSSEDKTNLRETSEDQRIAENIKPVLLGNKFFIHATGKTLNSDKDFMHQLKNSTPCLQEVKTVDECDFILVFCPVVSRAGTDIEAAEKSLYKISATKPAVLVVLHYTFDTESVVSDSSRSVTRENMITYDCLFHEDQGLLKCTRNADVINDIKTQIKTQTKIQKAIMVSIERLNRNNKSEQRSSTRKENPAIDEEIDEEIREQSKQGTQCITLPTKTSASSALLPPAPPPVFYSTPLPPNHTTSQETGGHFWSSLVKCLWTVWFWIWNLFHCNCSKYESLEEPKNPEQDLEKNAYEKSPLRIVMLGRKDSGKSSARNTILGIDEKIQAAATVATSTSTQQSESTQGEVAGKKVIVVETPDWFSPGLSPEKVREDVDLCVQMSSPGPHAFLLVIPVRHYTNKDNIEDELKVILPKMEEMFGEGCYKNTIILFTITDEHQRKNTEILIQSENEEVQTLLEKCGNRFFCLNIRESGGGSQVSELFEKIEMVNGSE